MDVDQGRLEAFMGRMIGHMTGAALCYSIWLGDELGLYRELAGSGPGPPIRWPKRPAATRGWCASGSTARPPAAWSPTTPTRTPTSSAPRPRWPSPMKTRPCSWPGA